MSSPCEEYPPSEDTFLLCDYIEGLYGEAALEVGSGSGYITRILERRFGLVACTDISHCILANQTYRAENRICCNAADALRGQFDLIVSNPPYLDADPIRFQDTDGGSEGMQVSCMFVRSAAPLLRRGGQMAVVSSSLSRHDRLMETAESMGMRARIAMRKKLFFEDLFVVRIDYL